MTADNDRSTCEHYWFIVADESGSVDSMVKQVCGQPATGRMTWLGSRQYGKEDRDIAVCDKCRGLVETQNMFEQAERDGTLRDLLGF